MKNYRLAASFLNLCFNYGEMNIMNNISIANDTLKIIKNGAYTYEGREVVFPDKSYYDADVYSPSRLEEIKLPEPEKDEMCVFETVNADSFEAARKYACPLVMNFANAHVPGGGFKLGATAQEEALCRNSTLYASIGGKDAKEMYRYNKTHISATYSDYMLISPTVWVFRSPDGKPLDKPYKTAVVTIPAPNKHGSAALTPQSKIDAVMKHRLELMFKAAAESGYKDLVLGAWGCGAFGNDANKVAGYFKELLIDEGYGKYFENICFAVHGKPTGKNYTAFKNTFAE